jgi:hypothetical protein
VAVDLPRRKPWLEALGMSLAVGITFGILLGYFSWAGRGHLSNPARLSSAGRMGMNTAAIAWWISFPGFWWISVRRARPRLNLCIHQPEMRGPSD